MELRGGIKIYTGPLGSSLFDRSIYTALDTLQDYIHLLFLIISLSYAAYPLFLSRVMCGSDSFTL